jgi:hypothetical protein
MSRVITRALKGNHYEKTMSIAIKKCSIELDITKKCPFSNQRNSTN